MNYSINYEALPSNHPQPSFMTRGLKYARRSPGVGGGSCVVILFILIKHKMTR